jgi:hypothetical protein
VDLGLVGEAHEPGHSQVNDAIFQSDLLQLTADPVSLRRLGSAHDVPLGWATVTRRDDGVLAVEAVIVGPRIEMLRGCAYLSLGVSLGYPTAEPPAVTWVSLGDRESYPGQRPYRLTSVPPSLLRGLRGRDDYRPVRVPTPADPNVTEWWHRDDPELRDLLPDHLDNLDIAEGE